MEAVDSLEYKRAILEYWMLVEFFSPYLLDPFLNSNQHYQRVFAEDQIDLPWSEHKALAEDDPGSTFSKGYHLYLGLQSDEMSEGPGHLVFASFKVSLFA